MKAVFKVAKKALPSASIYFFIFIALTIAFSVIAGKEQEKNVSGVGANHRGKG